MLLDAALDNTQVRYILNDPDVKTFYLSILSFLPEMTEKAEKVKSEIR